MIPDSISKHGLNDSLCSVFSASASKAFLKLAKLLQCSEK